MIGCFDEFVPELRAPLGIAECALLLDPHRRRQYNVGRHGGDRRIGFGYDDEILRIAVTRIGLVIRVRRRLKVVVRGDPVGVELTVFEHAVLLNGVIADLIRQSSGGSFQIASAVLRCSGLVTSMSAGRRWAKQPTSRAVPHAEGWPVSENGLLPGSEIFPVSR